MTGVSPKGLGRSHLSLGSNDFVIRSHPIRCMGITYLKELGLYFMARMSPRRQLTPGLTVFVIQFDCNALVCSIRSDPTRGRNTCNLGLVGRTLTLNPKPGWWDVP